MKRKLSIVVVVVLFVIVALCGCASGDYIEKESAKLDTYTMKCAYDEASHTLSVTQVSQTINTSDESFTKLMFHLYPNAYRAEAKTTVVPTSYRKKAYIHGDSFGDIAIDSVKVGDTAVAYTVEGVDSDILCVPLSKELFPNEMATITLVYEVHLANIAHRLGYGDNAVNFGNFYPVLCYVSDGQFACDPYYNIGDPFVTNMANYNVTLQLPKEYVLATSGNIESKTEADKLCVYEICAKTVRDFAFVCSKNFKVLQQVVGNTTVNYYHFADKTSAETLVCAASALQYFNDMIGVYPYAQLSIVETDFCYGGMEYPNMVMINSLTEQYTTAVVHEISHQWFYNLVGNDQVRSAWMDEGLAEFCTLRYFDAKNEATMESQMKNILKAYTTYVDVLSNYNKKFNTAMNRALNEYMSDTEYVYMNYVKGCIMFYSLYDTMGAKKFDKALSTYFNKCKLTVASPQSMMNCFTNAYGASLDAVFNAYLAGEDVISQGNR